MDMVNDFITAEIGAAQNFGGPTKTTDTLRKQSLVTSVGPACDTDLPAHHVCTLANRGLQSLPLMAPGTLRARSVPFCPSSQNSMGSQ